LTTGQEEKDNDMEYRPINDNYAVAGQITPAQVAEIKAAGFKSVICNRPDAEQPGQPTAAEIKAAVEAAGLTFRHIPVVSGHITGDDVDKTAAALAELEGPVFAYCRSGSRSTNLFMMAQQRR
jgi:uncharacterized protein (TIGR01244 family)